MDGAGVSVCVTRLARGSCVGRGGVTHGKTRPTRAPLEQLQAESIHMQRQAADQAGTREAADKPARAVAVEDRLGLAIAAMAAGGAATDQARLCPVSIDARHVTEVPIELQHSSCVSSYNRST
jgi:hypothetical protein